jgi:hypothetical protein
MRGDVELVATCARSEAPADDPTSTTYVVTPGPPGGGVHVSVTVEAVTDEASADGASGTSDADRGADGRVGAGACVGAGAGTGAGDGVGAGVGVGGGGGGVGGGGADTTPVDTA